MFKNFMAKLKESFMAVFPITLVIFALVIFFVPTEIEAIAKLAISAVLLLIGMALFTMGADSAMEELGKNIGSTLTKSNKLWFMIACSFVIGFMITFAEPDLMVLANQVAEYSSLNNVWIFISTVSLGVGIFLMFAILKLVFMHYALFIALYLKGNDTPLYIALFSKNSFEFHMNAQLKEEQPTFCCAGSQQTEPK